MDDTHDRLARDFEQPTIGEQIDDKLNEMQRLAANHGEATLEDMLADGENPKTLRAEIERIEQRDEHLASELTLWMDEVEELVERGAL